MKPLMTVTLAGGAQTEVLLAEDIKDLSAHLGDYGRSVLWVFDSNTNKLFRQLPPARIILDSGEQSKNLTSLERIISSPSMKARPGRPHHRLRRGRRR